MKKALVFVFICLLGCISSLIASSKNNGGEEGTLDDILTNPSKEKLSGLSIKMWEKLLLELAEGDKPYNKEFHEITQELEKDLINQIKDLDETEKAGEEE